MNILRVIFLYGLFWTFPLYAQESRLLSVNYAENTDKQLELKFLLSAKAEYTSFFLTKPRRLVVDFSHTVLSHKAPLLLEQSSYLDAIRSARKGKNNLRVVFDFKKGVVPKGRIVVIESETESETEKQLSLKLAVNTDFKPALSETSALGAEVRPPVTAEITEFNLADKNEKSIFSDWELSGSIGLEELGFFYDKLDFRQHNNYISGFINPELYREWDEGKQSFTFSPFYRYSQYDNRRTHFDIRELTWLLSERDWELRVGFRKVFWGVAEGLHLVDIINQTDLVENTDTEDKLGQPMINLALIRDWGTLDLFILPGFRERTYAGSEGRLRSFPEVSVGDAEFDAHGFKKQVAYAIRWSRVVGNWDIGLSHFYGTTREPVFKPRVSALGQVSLIPFYELINQTGLDLQLTYEDWIFKHEGIIRAGQGKTFYAATTGFEYTLFDLYSTGLDLGFVVEYMYDTRGGNNISAPFQDDFLTALRFGFNDVQSTEILAGVLFDRTNNSKFYNIEASRRLGDSFKLDLEVRLFSGAPITDASSYAIRDDDHIRLEIGYYF